MNEMQAWLTLVCVVLGVACLGLGAYSLFSPKRPRQAPAAAAARPDPEPAARPARVSFMREAEERGKDLAEEMVLLGVAQEKAFDYAALLQRGAARATAGPAVAPPAAPGAEAKNR